MISFDKVAKRVFQILKSRGYGLKMYKENGENAFDPSVEARKFFVEEEGIMVAINRGGGDDSEIKVYISEESNLEEIESLLVSLRQTANFFGLLYNVRKYGKKLKPKEFAFLAYKTQREEEEDMKESVSGFKNIAKVIDALLLREFTPKQVREELKKFEFSGMHGPLKFQVDEYIQEGYRNLAEAEGEYYADEEDGTWYVFHSETGKGHASYMSKVEAEKKAAEMNENINEAKDTSNLWGTSQSSYQRIGSSQARLVVRHSQPVDEDKFAARSRHINKIFIENADGERIKFPVIFLQGARAMTRHVSMGGNFNDAIGEHIQHISEEYDILRTFKKNAGRKLHEQATNIIGLVRTRGKEITAEVKGMQGPTSYKRYVENFQIKEQALEEEIVMLEVQHIKKLFESIKQYDGIDEAFIVVARLSRMNEDFDILEAMIESGEISFTPKREMHTTGHSNRSEAMMHKLRDLAERSADPRVSGFISRIAEKINNEIPMERNELNLVKGLVKIAEDSATPMVEALDDFLDWADNYLVEGSKYLDRPRRSEKEARRDIEDKKKRDSKADATWTKNKEQSWPKHSKVEVRSNYSKKIKPTEEVKVDEKSPEGWEGTVKSMKKYKEIDNPWALAHHMKGKGYKSHKTKSGKTKKESFKTRSTDSIKENEIENIIRFQELAGIQKKR